VYHILEGGTVFPFVKVAQGRRKAKMYRYDTEVEILVNGKPVRKYSHEGKTFIQANRGTPYAIRVKNNSPNRRMFNVSVDGVNVVNGQPAGSSNLGYVIPGYSSYEVVGFRTSNEEVHPFKFNIKERSYAAKSDETQGDTSNCGVIGVEVYEEKEKPQPVVKHVHHYHKEKEYIPYDPYPWRSRPWRPWSEPIWTCNLGDSGAGEMLRSSSATRGLSAGNITAKCANMSFSAESANLAGAESWSAGTEFSKDAVEDRVTTTSFEIGSLLTTFEIFYDFKEGLLKTGVPITKEAKVAAPSAFPSRFCKPPRD
jgi:hypothetical protein